MDSKTLELAAELNRQLIALREALMWVDSNSGSFSRVRGSVCVSDKTAKQIKEIVMADIVSQIGAAQREFDAL